MQVTNQVSSDEAQRDAFFGEGAPDGPFAMVNLLKFKERAEYPDGRESDLTGAEAYAIYGAAVSQMIVALGGRMLHGGAVTGLMLGEVEELWDMVGIAEYPNSKAFRDMLDSPEYQQIHIHREAGLAGQLNIRTTSSGR